MDINGNPKRTYFSIMDYHKRTELNPIGAPAISHLSACQARIEDHNSEVLSCDFHPGGKFLLSSNRDGELHICSTDNESTNMALLKDHTGPALEAHFAKDGYHIYSCSADETVGIWDGFHGVRTSTLEGHTGAVNSVQGGRIGYPIICSGSEDGTVRIWDARDKECAMILDSGDEVYTTCFNENGEYAFSAGIGNDITIWDLRMNEIVRKLQAHLDSVTGICLSPCGSYLLSQSIDSTLRIWDIRPYAPADRSIGCFPSLHKKEDGLMRCAWSVDSGLISSGTSDHVVCIWDALSGVKLFELPTYNSSITAVAFHPNELMMLTSSNDKYLYLYELDK